MTGKEVINMPRMFEVKEESVRTVFRTMSELREIVEYYTEKEYVVMPKTPNGDVSGSLDSPVIKWYRKSQRALKDSKIIMNAWANKYCERSSQCANYNGNDRREPF
jgi:hypothetical protein